MPTSKPPVIHVIVQDEASPLGLSRQLMCGFFDRDRAEAWIAAQKPDSCISYFIEEIEVEDLPTPTPEVDAPPPGERCSLAGKCHGPQQWCDDCGDVSNVCDEPVCDVHMRGRRGDSGV